MGLYCSYINLVRPVDIQDNEDHHQEEMADMELKLEVMEAHVDACKDISETYMLKERQFKDEILLLKVDKDEL